jgi:hypothetical protein
MPEWDEVLPGGAAPPRREGNGVGIAGFVCGLISLVLAVIPIIFFFVSVPTGVAGVILSVMGRRRAAEGAPSGDLSTAGLVLSIVSLSWTFLWFVAVF